MMRVSSMLLVGGAVLFATTLRANASLMTYDVTFSAAFDNSTDYGGGTQASGYTAGGTPVNPVTGSFTITFDPTLTYTDDTADITQTSLGIASDSAMSFDYSPTGNADGLADELVVGGVTDGAATILLTDPLPNDYYLHILDFTTAPAFGQLGYTETDQNVYFYTLATGNDSVSVTLVPPFVAVPEPTSLAMLGSGLLAFGWVRRRRLG